MKKKSKVNHSTPSSVSCNCFQSTRVAPAVKEAVCHCQVVAKSASEGEVGGTQPVSIKFFYPSSWIKSVSQFQLGLELRS